MPSSRDLPSPGTESVSAMSPALAGGFLTTSATWEALGPSTLSANNPILFLFMTNMSYLKIIFQNQIIYSGYLSLLINEQYIRATAFYVLVKVPFFDLNFTD